MRMSPYDRDVGAFFKIALVVFKQDVLIVLSILKLSIFVYIILYIYNYKESWLLGVG